MTMGPDPNERIVGVAIYLKNGLILYRREPARHHNLTQSAADMGVSTIGCEQGFLTSNGNFVRRKPAELIARRCGQLQGKMIGSTLTSEDLW